MHDMTNMRLLKTERRHTAPTAPDYPWGLTINLDTAALKKLGIKDLPEIGTECMIHAVGKVTRVSESASEKKEDRSLEIQIIKLAIIHDEDEDMMWDRVKSDRKAY